MRVIEGREKRDEKEDEREKLKIFVQLKPEV